MSLENLTDKYAGHRITDTDLNTATDSGALTVLADMLRTAAYRLHSTEDQLLQVVSSIEVTVANIRDNVNADAGQPIRHLNDTGELLATGIRTDVLIAQRGLRIEHLRALVWLWRQRTGPTAPITTTTTTITGDRTT